MLISLDTETTGVDVYHGAKPFFVTICREDGTQTHWEWGVDPVTREPEIPFEDRADIQDLIAEADECILQNPKFDYSALRAADERLVQFWDWSKVKDTLLAGHLLASNQPHNLTDMALHYLGVDIQPYEDRLEVACKEARNIVRKLKDEDCQGWRIAKEGEFDMPSAGPTVWKFDTWLPNLLAERGIGGDYERGHPWRTVLAEYANTDSAVTLALWRAMEAELKRRNLWDIYLTRLKVLPIAAKMEQRGITISKTRLDQLLTEYGEESAKAGSVCVNIADGLGYQLELPKSGNNKSLVSFVFDGLKLPAIKRSKKTGLPSLDKAVLEQYEATLPARSKALTFVKALKGKRKRDTAISYMESYSRFWMGTVGHRDWYVLHPSLNPTGTDTLRWSSSNPNEQNISKQEGFNLRYCFGPAPGREWWSLDAKNLELRIPAYESGERMMVDLFDRDKEPPYYGSYHLLIFDILHPEKFAKDGMKCKDIYESTWYQWTKNGNFKLSYGGQDADSTYHQVGATEKVRKRLAGITALNRKQIEYANKYGYVETIPDKSVDPNRGYPLICSRSEYGKVLETVPLNYHVQGTAMWWMQMAMIRCQEQLDKWNRSAKSERYAIALQVHDELVFDFPFAGNPEPTEIANGNFWRIRELQKLMERGGEDIGVKTPVSIEYHEDTWSTGIIIK